MYLQYCGSDVPAWMRQFLSFTCNEVATFAVEKILEVRIFILHWNYGYSKLIFSVIKMSVVLFTYEKWVMLNGECGMRLARNEINTVTCEYISYKNGQCEEVWRCSRRVGNSRNCILMMWFWVKALYGLVVKRQHFGEACCLCPSWRWRGHVWLLPASPHDFLTQKHAKEMVIAMRTLNLT
jgi:hypothetical protein